MIDWGRSFETNGVYFKPEQLVTNDLFNIEEKLNVTHHPGTYLIPTERKYMEQDKFSNAKIFLMRRMLQSGYPYNCQVMRPGGFVTHNSSAKNIWSGVFYKSQREQLEDTRPTGSNQVVFSELERIGKCASVSVEHIVVDNTNEPLLDPVMVITDVWEQTSKFLPYPITFMTAYAHINGMPNDWYTQIHLFIFDGKFHLFPEYLTSNKTVDMSEKNLVKNVLFNIDDPSVLKVLANGLVLSDPIWTTQEEIFETQSPIWFNRFLKDIPSIFERTRIDEYNSKRPIMFMISESNDPDLSNIMTASWIQYPTESTGFFTGYAYNTKTNKLVYGVFKTNKNGNNYISAPIIIHHEDDVVAHPECNIIFRPGFKKFVERQQPQPQFGTRLNIQMPSDNTIGDAVEMVTDE